MIALPEFSAIRMRWRFLDLLVVMEIVKDDYDIYDKTSEDIINEQWKLLNNESRAEVLKRWTMQTLNR